MQKGSKQLLLITSYKCVYQEVYKIPIHSLWHTIEVLPQPLYVTSSCKSAIALSTWICTCIEAMYHVSTSSYNVSCSFPSIKGGNFLLWSKYMLDINSLINITWFKEVNQATVLGHCHDWDLPPIKTWYKCNKFIWCYANKTLGSTVAYICGVGLWLCTVNETDICMNTSAQTIMSLGEETGGIASEIISDICKAVGIQGHKTGHSGEVMCPIVLHQLNFSDQLIKERTYRPSFTRIFT